MGGLEGIPESGRRFETTWAGDLAFFTSKLSPQAQDVLLRQQCRLAAEVQPELARQWANEMFLLAGQAKGAERSDGQDFAMSILARVDPDRALELLHAVELNSDDNKSMPFPAYTQLVQQVFQMLVQRRW